LYGTGAITAVDATRAADPGPCRQPARFFMFFLFSWLVPG
jgi:hypothetical protein